MAELELGHYRIDPKAAKISSTSLSEKAARLLFELLGGADPNSGMLQPMELGMPLSQGLNQKLVSQFNKSRLAKIGEPMMVSRKQMETVPKFTSHPGRGSVFATIGEGDPYYPHYMGEGGEGGHNLVKQLVEPRNPLTIRDPMRQQIGTETIKSLEGETFFKKLRDLFMSNDPLGAAKFGGLNKKEIKSITEHNAFKDSMTKPQLIMDAIAAKLAKFYGFDAILPLTESAPRTASEMMILK